MFDNRAGELDELSQIAALVEAAGYAETASSIRRWYAASNITRALFTRSNCCCQTKDGRCAAARCGSALGWRRRTLRTGSVPRFRGEPVRRRGTRSAFRHALQAAPLTLIGQLDVRSRSSSRGSGGDDL